MGERLSLENKPGFVSTVVYKRWHIKETEEGAYTCLKVSPDVVPFASASAIGLALYVGVSVPMSSKIFCAWRKRIMRSILLVLVLFLGLRLMDNGYS